MNSSNGVDLVRFCNNAVYSKNYTESSGSYKFLHKDYLGSILAIMDEAGNDIGQSIIAITDVLF